MPKGYPNIPRLNGRYIHGDARTSEYRIWQQMKTRCLDKNNPGYQYYGARGIEVYEPWVKSFPLFLQHLGRRPSPKYSLDRVDNDGNYEPGNVRWATRKEQCRNTRALHLLTIDGVTRCATEWAEIRGVNPRTIFSRLHRGYEGEALFVKPSRGKKWR